MMDFREKEGLVIHHQEADLLPDILEAGFDILSSTRTSTANMKLAELKKTLCDVLTFLVWGNRHPVHAAFRCGRANSR